MADNVNRDKLRLRIDVRVRSNMTETKVVRLRRKEGKIVQGCDIYIGRQCTMGGWNLPKSDWYNPINVKDCKDRTDCLQQYLDYMRTRPDLLARLGELKGKTLGCWCKPEMCHGDVLKALIIVLKI